ncbi:MAG TPA: hypothetical protein VK501_14410 [Baekduia sp.]|uniref:hypothetical protein n=1 Tax=Baekduia sp. TaxID=2600305 RepID=UPI002C20F114|nr:hypothetical protein [Baekduia sp.]HMJ35100.1 hypothetical protein [Baekduia sp.]
MGFFRGIDGSEPIRPQPLGRLSGTEEERKVSRSWTMASGTLACPSCDAPVAPMGPLSPADALACPFCAHAARVRDFLSLATPTRPAHVVVRVIQGRSGSRTPSR